MATTFDLFEDPWIRVLYDDGTHREVGVRQAMVDAHRIRTLEAEEATLTVALYRLLLAVAQRLAGPFEADEWPRLWEEGLPLEGLETIGEGRWELFPTEGVGFGQDPVGRPELAGVGALTAFADRGAGGMLWQVPQELSMAETARWLLWCHAYDTAGIRSRHLKGKEMGVPTGPAGAAPYTLLVGATLAQTLLLNLVPGERGAAGQGWWERTEAVVERRKGRRPVGVVDLLCWPSRRVRLHADEDGMVREVVITAGDDLKTPEDPGHGARQETDGAYRTVTGRSLKATVPGLAAPDGRQKGRRLTPEVIDFLGERHHLLERVGVSTTTVVFGTQRAVIQDTWTRTWTLPAAALVPGSPAHDRLGVLVEMLALAERAAHHIGQALARPSGDTAQQVGNTRTLIHREWSPHLAPELPDLEEPEALVRCREVLLATVDRHLGAVTRSMGTSFRSTQQVQLGKARACRDRLAAFACEPQAPAQA